MGNEIANMWAYDGQHRHRGRHPGALTVRESGERFVVDEVSYTPTWVDRVSKAVLPVAHTLAYGPSRTGPPWPRLLPGRSTG